MKVSDFDYDLPPELIAQTPIPKRSDSRLLVLNRKTGEIKHRRFYDITAYFKKGDVLVLNDTKVIPSRLHGIKEETGAKIEFLILKNVKDDIYQCLAKPARRVRKGTKVVFSPSLSCTVEEKEEDGICLVSFVSEGDLLEVISSVGEVPLPPYIHQKMEDGSRYQTIYAENIGSAAAPTAGLHFTDAILKSLVLKGVQIEKVTLNIGLDTFRPVSESEVEEHQMHREYFTLKKDVAERLNKAKEEKRRIVAVGTTSVRLLEAVMHKYGKFRESGEDTDIFIYPGFDFRAVDAMITNFHLPKSTLIMLVSAFAGRENILKAYRAAIDEKYRFFSFGDAMFIE